MNPQDPRPPRILPPHGHDQGLLCYQKAEVLYDLTFHFAHKHLAKGNRTVDPMIQAARCGKQNILGRRNPQSFDLDRDLAETRPGEVVAHVAMESFWATLKLDLVYRTRSLTHADAHQQIFGSIARFYNTQRLHSALGYLSPA